MRPLPAALGLAIYAVALGALPPALAQPEPRPVAVIVLSERSCCWERPARLDAQLKRDLAALGIAVQESAAYYQDATRELLAQFEVVVAMYPPTASGSSEAKAYLEKSALLLDHVRAGGGLLILGDTQYGSRDPLNSFLAPLDAEVLQESVYDEDAQFRQERFFREYFLTTASFATHPLTEGLSRLCFPCAWHPWKGAATNAVRVGGDWQVVVRGGTSARSVAWSADEPTAGTYASEPPIVAARAFGEGRVVLLPTRSVTTLQSGHHFVFEELCYARGDLTRFVRNALAWLSEPARAAGRPGGYVESAAEPGAEQPTPEQLAAMDPYTRLIAAGYRAPLTRIEHEFRPRSDFVGVIGIHSDFSRRMSGPAVAGGYGTVADYCGKAKALGYDFIAFTERFELMDEGSWGELAQQCAAGSDGEFLAIPGIEIEDVYGDHYAVLDLPRWVDKQWLDPSGRYIADSPAFYFGLGHAFNSFPARFLLEPGQAFNRPWFAKFYAGMEVAGYSRGETPIAGAEDWYRVCQRNDYNLIPMVSHRIASPRDLEAVSGYRVHVTAETLADVPKAFRYGWYTPRDVYVSSGPRLLEWAIENGRAALREEPWQLFLRLSSDVPLSEVTVWDGDTVFRRYFPGDTTFTADISGYHDRQRYFLLTATDEAGGRLISPALYTSDVRHSTYMCTDLQNTINGMLDVNRQGRTDHFRIQGLYVSGWNNLDVPALVSTKDVLPESGIEYGMAPMVGAPGPIIHAAEGPEHPVAQRNLAFACGDVNILDNLYEWTLLPGSYQCRAELADSRVRLISFTPRPYSQNVMLVEHTVTLKKRVTLARRDGPEIVLLTLNTGASAAQARDFANAASEGFPRMSIVSAAGDKREFADRTAPVEEPLPVGGYVAFYPNFWGPLAAMPLSEGLTMRVTDQTEIGLELPGETLEAGATFTARCLVLRGAFGETDGGEFDRFRDSCGLDGSPACPAQVTRGRLLGSAYILRLEAEDGAAVFSLPEGSLANPLPVVVEGLREDCDAVALNETTGELRRVGVFEGAGWLTADTARGAQSWAVGNALDCDCDGLRLSLLKSDDRYMLEAHNPTAQAQTAMIRVPDWLAPTTGRYEGVLELAPGATRREALRK